MQGTVTHDTLSLDFFLATWVTMPAHTTILPSWAQPTCQNIPAFAFFTGATSSVFGLDRVFVRVGAPPAVHWMLGGVGAEYYCKGTVSADRSTATAAAMGYIGGVVARSVGF